MNAITAYQPRDIDEIQRTASLLVASGYFETRGDSKQQIAQIATKIMAGAELGYGPFAAVQGIHVIQGQPAMSANLMAAAVKGSPKYDYRVSNLTDTSVSVEFFQGDQSLGVSTFTADDAQRAGTKNMGKYPRNMLFARAISNGVRWFCPDVFNGGAVYTPDELGAPINDDGEFALAAQPNTALTDPVPSLDDVPELDSNPFEDAPSPKASAAQIEKIQAIGLKLYDDQWDDECHGIVGFITNNPDASTKDLNKADAVYLIEVLELMEDMARAYGETWQDKSGELCSAVSSGETDHVIGLTEAQRRQLAAGMQKKLQAA